MAQTEEPSAVGDEEEEDGDHGAEPGHESNIAAEQVAGGIEGDEAVGDPAV